MTFRQPQPRQRRRSFAQLTGLPAHPVGHPDHARSQSLYEFLIPDTQRDLAYGVYLTMALARIHPDPLVESMYSSVREYYQRLEDHLAGARAHDLTAWQRARRMGSFPEPEELGFGYAQDGRDGNGIQEGELSLRILHTLRSHRALSVACAEEPDALALIELVALDRVSDVVATITKRELIRYTQEMAGRYRFSPDCIREVAVPNIWNPDAGKLETQVHVLPVADDGRAILVVPKGIVRSAPPFTPAQYTRFYYPGRRPMTKAEVLADIGDNPDRLLRAMRHVFEDDWRFRPRRDLRDE